MIDYLDGYYSVYPAEFMIGCWLSYRQQFHVWYTMRVRFIYESSHQHNISYNKKWNILETLERIDIILGGDN